MVIGKGVSQVLLKEQLHSSQEFVTRTSPHPVRFVFWARNPTESSMIAGPTAAFIARAGPLILATLFYIFFFSIARK